MFKPKQFMAIIIIVACAMLTKMAFGWRNPGPYYDVRPQTDLALYHMICGDPNHKEIALASMDHSFKVYFVKNMKPNSYNPYFPAIYIQAHDECNGWLQVINTDRPDCYGRFIDTTPKDQEPYPFYNRNKDFTDNPIWSYGLLFKPVSYWIGHAYAVHVDEEQKTITCLGGVSWGYRFVWWWLRPIMILPVALDKKDWQTDWKTFQIELPGYKNIES